MRYFVYFFLFSCLSIDVISGSFKPPKDLSTNVKLNSIGWVDPDNMVYNDDDDDDDDDGPHLGFKPMHLIGSNNFKGGFGQKNVLNTFHMYEGYLRRFINLFLRSSGLEGYKLKPGSVKQVHFEYIIDHEQLEILQNFGQSGNDLENVDAVLTKLFIPHEGTFFEHRSSTRDEYTIAWFSKIFKGIIGRYICEASTEALIFTSVAVVWLGTFWTTYISGNYRLPIINVLILVFFSGFAFTWVRMYQEAEAEAFQAAMAESNAPPFCRGGQVPWYTSFYYFLAPPDCSQYYKNRMVSPMVKISPSIVLSETISQLFLHPASHIGKAYGDFVMGASGSVSWYLKIIIVPISFMVPIVFIFGIIILCMGSKISVGPLGLSILPQWSKSKRIKDKSNDSYVEDNKERHIENVIPEKNVEKETSVMESMLSNVQKPLVILNWGAFKRMMFSNRSLGVDTETKSITNYESSSEHSEKSDKVIEKKRKKKRDTSRSGDTTKTTDKQIKKENYSKQGKTSKSQEKEHQKSLAACGDFTEASNEDESELKNKNSTTNEDCNLDQSDIPSTSTNTQVQQWLDESYIP